jgi:hypothetical protein
MRCEYVVWLKLNHSNFAVVTMYMRFPQNSVEKAIHRQNLNYAIYGRHITDHPIQEFAIVASYMYLIAFVAGRRINEVERLVPRQTNSDIVSILAAARTSGSGNSPKGAAPSGNKVHPLPHMSTLLGHQLFCCRNVGLRFRESFCRWFGRSFCRQSRVGALLGAFVGIAVNRFTGLPAVAFTVVTGVAAIVGAL